ncbi:hypothetical protein [Reinekea sp.]|jgi:hypothetical protein|uniref:hypothetical protein n=1 Tax=Reinekea sp. TaxID=1970455 RepID=UPI00398A2952
MQSKFLNALRRWYFLARPLYWLSALCLLATLAWPVIQPEMDTLYWFSALSVSAFLMASAAILDISHQHGQPKAGLSGWFLKLWNQFMFWIWFATSAALLIFLIKILAYMQSH